MGCGYIIPLWLTLVVMTAAGDDGYGRSLQHAPQSSSLASLFALSSQRFELEQTRNKLLCEPLGELLRDVSVNS